MANWPGDDAIFPFCMPIIKKFEGFRAEPYKDSAGIPTIGYGTIRYPNGAAVTMDDPAVDEATAEGYLSYEMGLKAASIGPGLERPASLHEAAAMLSLAYNIGTGAFGESTVRRRFNAGNIPGAADAFLMWDKVRVNGKLVVSTGLKNRRTEERTIFLTPDGPAVA